MLTTDRVAGGALALLALVVMFESRKLPLGSLRSPGPAYMPIALAILLLAFGLSLILLGNRATALTGVGWREWPHAIAILGACAFGAVAFERLGYRLTVALILAFLLGLVERKGVVRAAVFALGLALGTFLLFDTFLRVPLPRGPFGL